MDCQNRLYGRLSGNKIEVYIMAQCTKHIYLKLLPQISTVSGFCVEFSAHSVEHEVGGVPKTEETYEGPAIQSDAKTTIGGEKTETFSSIKQNMMHFINLQCINYLS